MDHSTFSPAPAPLHTKLWKTRRYLNFTPVFIVGFILWLLLIPAFFSEYGQISVTYDYKMKGKFDINDIFLLSLVLSALVGLYTSLLLRKHRCTAILWSLYTVFYHFAMLWPTLYNIWEVHTADNSNHYYWSAETLWLQMKETALPPVIKNCCIALALFWLLYIIGRLCIKLYEAKISPEAADTADQSTPLLSSPKQYLPLLLNLLFLLPIATTMTLIIVNNMDLQYRFSDKIDSTMGIVLLVSFFLVFPICANIYCRKNPVKAYLQMKTASYAFFVSTSVQLMIVVLFFGDFTLFDTGNLEGYLLGTAFSIPLFCYFASYRVGKLQGLSTTPMPFPKTTKTILLSCSTLSGFAAFMLLAPRLLLVRYESFNILFSAITADTFVIMWLIVMAFPFATIYATWCLFKASKPLRAMLCSFFIIPIAILGIFLYRSLGETAPKLFIIMMLVFLINIWLFFGFYSLGKWRAKCKLKKQALAAS